MKGLLLKDLYMMKAYCKSYLLIVIVFLGVSFFGGNLFFIYYPCLLCGMIPVNLLAYDERSKFLQYSTSLPCKKTQIVSSKYIIGLFSQVTVLLVTGTVLWIRMNANGTFSAGEFIFTMFSLLLVSTLAASIPLPFIFKYGVEKGRLAYYIMIGFVCGASVLFSGTLGEGILTVTEHGLIVAIFAAVGICTYILSWCLSVAFYKKREL